MGKIEIVVVKKQGSLLFTGYTKIVIKADERSDIDDKLKYILNNLQGNLQEGL